MATTFKRAARPTSSHAWRLFFLEKIARRSANAARSVAGPVRLHGARNRAACPCHVTARMAIIWIGLLGATGDIAFDDITMTSQMLPAGLRHAAQRRKRPLCTCRKEGRRYAGRVTARKTRHVAVDLFNT